MGSMQIPPEAWKTASRSALLTDRAVSQIDRSLKASQAAKHRSGRVRYVSQFNLPRVALTRLRFTGSSGAVGVADFGIGISCSFSAYFCCFILTRRSPSRRSIMISRPRNVSSWLCPENFQSSHLLWGKSAVAVSRFCRIAHRHTSDYHPDVNFIVLRLWFHQCSLLTPVSHR